MDKIYLQSVDEKCVYKPDPSNASATICQREAWIGSNKYGFAKPIEKFGYKRFKSNTEKAVKGFEYVLNKLYMPENIPVDSMRQLNLNTEKIRTTARSAKDAVKEKAKEKVSVVVTYAGRNTS